MQCSTVRCGTKLPRGIRAGSTNTVVSSLVLVPLLSPCPPPMPCPPLQPQVSARKEQAAPGEPEWELRRHAAQQGEIEEAVGGPSLLAGKPSADRKVCYGQYCIGMDMWAAMSFAIKLHKYLRLCRSCTCQVSTSLVGHDSAR